MVIGFRNFIEGAEKNRLEALLDEDPDYFYNTLPYAQALGVTKKWIDKFDGITIQPPTFCEADYTMDSALAMGLFMNDLNKMNDCYIEAFKHLNSPTKMFRGYNLILLGAPSVLDMFHIKEGELLNEVELLEKVMPN